jgi:hypothetical protein
VWLGLACPQDNDFGLESASPVCQLAQKKANIVRIKTMFAYWLASE